MRKARLTGGPPRASYTQASGASNRRAPQDHNAFKIELARRAMVRTLTQAARRTPQSQSNKKIA